MKISEFSKELGKNHKLLVYLNLRLTMKQIVETYAFISETIKEHRHVMINFKSSYVTKIIIEKIDAIHIQRSIRVLILFNNTCKTLCMCGKKCYTLRPCPD